MGKVRLDFYFGLGVELVAGDEYTGFSGLRIVVGENCRVSTANATDEDDRHRFIESFADRENKGVQPVPDGFPVVVRDCYSRTKGCVSNEVLWDLSCGEEEIEAWKPDYNKILEMQKEHDAEQEKPIEELMINAKESKMSKNNKHPHHDLIVEWLKDTSKAIQVKSSIKGEFIPSSVQFLIQDECGEEEFRFKPREFQKGNWYPCVDSCGDIEVNMWNGEGFVSITNAIICSQPGEFIQIGESLGEITFGGEE